MRKSNRGMALVVTMVILAMSLMLGMSAFNSALLGERMAGNYRAFAQAYNEAEAGIANASDMLRNPEEGFAYGLVTGEAALESFISDIEDDESLASLASLNGNLADLGRYELSAERIDPESIEGLTSNDLAFRLISDGSYGAAGHKAHRKVTGLFIYTRGGEVPVGVTSCEGISLSGSGNIDSYDSRNGPYDYFGNARRSNATINTLVDGAPITLNGSSPIYGKVKSTGDLSMTGSSPVIGDITANGDVTITGGDWWNSEAQQKGRIFGNVDAVGSVKIQGTIHGSVRANEEINLNSGSSIKGDATAPIITYPKNSNPSDFVDGSISEKNPGVEGTEAKAVPEDCSDFSVPEYRDKFAEVESSCSPDQENSCHLNLGGGTRDVVFSKNGITDPNGSPVYKVYSHSINGRDLSVLRIDSFTLGGAPNFIIGEPGRPVDAVMVIDGTTTIGGGGSFQISEGSTLQIVTSGEFHLGSGIVVGDQKPSKEVDGTIVPILSVLSTYPDGEKGKPGVQINGDSALYGLVAAPFSQVSIGGSGGLYGALNAREITISGAGGFHYDESLSEMPPLDGNSGEGSKPLLIHMSEVL